MSTQQDGIDPRELEHPSMPTKTNGITRRDFLMSGAMVAGGLSLAHLLAACGATPAPTAVPATAVPATAVPSAGLSGIVQMWEPDTRDDAVAASQWWYDAFHQANPGVTVNDLIVPYGDDVTKLKAASDAGTAPDIMWVYGDLHFSLGADGLTRPVNDLLARIGIDRYSAGVKDGIRLNDTYYSVPFVGFPFFVYYRKDIYEQKGLKPPETLDQMLANIQACNDPPTTYGYGLTNKDISDTWNLKTAMWTHGAYFFDADDNLALDRQETLDAWAYYKELGKVSPPGSMSQSDVEMRQLMIDGSIAHHFSTTSFSASFKEADIARLGAFLYPINPGGKGASLDFFGLPPKHRVPTWRRN
jgi:multiple sugar transport system substrate-binding protein